MASKSAAAVLARAPEGLREHVLLPVASCFIRPVPKILMSSTSVACAAPFEIVHFGDARSRYRGKDDLEGGTYSYLAVEANHSAVELHSAERLS